MAEDLSRVCWLICPGWGLLVLLGCAARSCFAGFLAGDSFLSPALFGVFSRLFRFVFQVHIYGSALPSSSVEGTQAFLCAMASGTRRELFSIGAMNNDRDLRSTPSPASKMKHSATVRPKAMLSVVLAEDDLPEVKYKTCASYRGLVAATAIFWPSQLRSSAAAEHMRINGDPAVDANGPCKMLLLGAWSIFRPPWILNLTAL
ncbi:uncharacterized protein [Triticum aestivum]|uniref:uncharacterized protein isoform X3 n=1 Tax=Triticum aestivum TaxID=4565 RepID=UPI001D00ADC9|nr:uncharacterized protein LOC123133475 isoform X3 [Triticum aestivum]